MQGYVQMKEAHEKTRSCRTLRMRTTMVLAQELVSANDGLKLKEHNNRNTGQRLAQKRSQQTISKHLTFPSHEKRQKCHCGQYGNSKPGVMCSPQSS